jgi:hypothetical protein
MDLSHARLHVRALLRANERMAGVSG